MKTIAVFTTTRAEYGLFRPLLERINQSKELAYLLFAGGTHLCDKYGFTLNEIQQDKNIKITDLFDFILNTDSRRTLACSLAIETMQVADLFEKYPFDGVMILGDRIELLPIVENALLYNKPVLHLYGGEITRGAIDNVIRNMISKAAHLHFVSCEEYAMNLHALGEDKSRIHVVGSLAVDNMAKIKRITKDELFSSLKLDIHLPTVLLTYHPVTIENKISAGEQIKNIFTALEPFNFQVVVTAPNVDPGNEFIIEEIKKQVNTHPRYHYIASLGALRYHSLVSHCLMVIGNSSSGIVEVPYYKIPSVNIGDRQQGRVRHPSVIDTGYSADEIAAGIQKAMDKTFRASLAGMPYKFGKGNSADMIVDIIQNISFHDEFLRK